MGARTGAGCERKKVCKWTGLHSLTQEPEVDKIRLVVSGSLRGVLSVKCGVLSVQRRLVSSRATSSLCGALRITVE